MHCNLYFLMSSIARQYKHSTTQSKIRTSVHLQKQYKYKHIEVQCNLFCPIAQVQLCGSANWKLPTVALVVQCLIIVVNFLKNSKRPLIPPAFLSENYISCIFSGNSKILQRNVASFFFASFFVASVGNFHFLQFLCFLFMLKLLFMCCLGNGFPMVYYKTKCLLESSCCCFKTV